MAAQLCPPPGMPRETAPSFRKETLDGTLKADAIENLILSFNSEGFEFDATKRARRKSKYGKKRAQFTQMTRDRRRNRKRSLMAHIATQIECIFAGAFDSIRCGGAGTPIVDSDGFVRVVDLLEHPRVKGLADDADSIVEALRGHPLFEIRVRTPNFFPSSRRHLLRDPRTYLQPMVRLMTRRDVIAAQLEQRFSDENLATDVALGCLIANNSSGYVPINALVASNATFRTLRVCHRELADVTIASTTLQLSPDRKYIRRGGKRSPPPPSSPPPPPSRMALATGNVEQTTTFVRKQVEYYFSTQNFLFDRFLQQLARRCTSDDVDDDDDDDDVAAHGGWIDVIELVKFPRLASLDTTPADLVDAVAESSSVVRLDSDRRSIRRRDVLPPVPPVVTSDGILLNRLCLPERRDDHGDVTVMQYNVLADHLARESWFPYAGDGVRSWHRRREMIKREILYHSPDLLCLQEVQSCYVEKADGSVVMATSGDEAKDNHVAWFSNWLRSAEYGLHYARKSPSAGQPAHGISIGNMICWKQKVFEVVEEKNVYVSKEIARCFPNDRVGVFSSSQMKDFCLRSADHFCAGYGQVACMVRLRRIDTGKELVLATVHITANYQAPDVQIMQTQACLKSLDAFSQASGSSPSPKLPVILCGDFNCTPDSGVVELLRNGSLENAHADLAVAIESRLILPYPNPRHNLKLSNSHDWAASVVAKETDSIPKLPLTNYTHTFQGTLDYVWFTPERGLEIVAALGGLPVEELSKETGLPSSRFPSDHLPVLCQLKMK